jgi:hypothetical protein
LAGSNFSNSASEGSASAEPAAKNIIRIGTNNFDADLNSKIDLSS